MTYRIAITGKGGTGKTTVSALIVNRLIAGGRRPVLAVDADPNSCLDTALGVKAEKTVGSVREDAREIAGKKGEGGIAKHELLEMKISESLVEADDFDLIAMGRPEGPGCYCFANNVLRQTIGAIAGSYPYLVIDNEAGLENLSRRIVQKVELLVIVSDPSHAGLETVGRLHALAQEMAVQYDRLAIIVNRLRDGRLPDRAHLLKEATAADSLVALPLDDQVAEYMECGKCLASLPPENPVIAAIAAFLDSVV